MDGIILAGGLGTRIRPLFPGIPKCLIPFDNKPFLSIQIQALASLGITRIFCALGFKNQQAIAALSEIKTNVNIFWHVEERPIGTLGAIRATFEYFQLNESYVFNGDTFVDITKNELMDLPHSERNTVFGVYMDDASAYGLIVQREDWVSDFREKKKGTSGWVNAGIYRLTKEAFDGINHREGSFEEIALPHLAYMSKLKLKRLAANNFYDIGTPSGYSSFLNYYRENLSKTDLKS